MTNSNRYAIEAYGNSTATFEAPYKFSRPSLGEAKLDADQCITVFEYAAADVYYLGDEDSHLVYSVRSKEPGVIDGRENEAPPPMPPPTFGFYAAAALYAAFPYIVMAITLPVWGPIALWKKVTDLGKPKPVYRGTIRPMHPLCKDAHSFPEHWNGKFPTNCSNCGAKFMGIGG